MPNGGLGFLAFRQWATGDAGPRLRRIWDSADLTINCRSAVSSTGRLFQRAATQPDFWRGYEGPVRSLTVYGSDHPAGPLSLTWRFDPGVHSASAIERLAAEHVAVLREVAEGAPGG
jgi:hypothetical protein